MTDKELSIFLNRELNILNTPSMYTSVDYFYIEAVNICNLIFEKIENPLFFPLFIDTIGNLMAKKPLTPIMESDDIWELADTCSGEDYPMTFVCNRCPSLYKTVYGPDNVKYSDIDRLHILNKTIANSALLSNVVRQTIDDIIPIVFPYCPSEKLIVDANLFDWGNWEAEAATMIIEAVFDGQGNKRYINTFLKENRNIIGSRFTKIDKKECYRLRSRM